MQFYVQAMRYETSIKRDFGPKTAFETRKTAKCDYDS